MGTAPEVPVTGLLTLDGMTKSFPGVKASDAVDLQLGAGEIHALLGENGAGKSTLVKMIYGILKPDSGQISWLGKPVSIDNPAAARKLGIAMVFQHFSLFDSMTVLENIYLGMRSGTDRSALERQIAEISDYYGLPLDPARHVYTLSVGERQRIEIIRCLLQNPKLLIMDEPTSVLTPQEVTRLFTTLRRLSDEGVSILYISHKLNEIKTLCTGATILRGGKVVDTVRVAEESPQSLATKMIGGAPPTGAGMSQRNVGEVRLDIRGLDCPADNPFAISLKNINLQVRSGEIVGIAGVAGNGQDELLKALNGEQVCSRADLIHLNGQPCADLKPNYRRALGMASIPEERLGHGAVPGMSLVENGLLTSFRRPDSLRYGFIAYRNCKSFCSRIIGSFNVKSSGIFAQAESLSGGNLQKFVTGREISQEPSVLVVSQPTWGVDAGAAGTIHDGLRKLAENGSAIVVISQDLDELMILCDRIAAICAGTLSEAKPVAQITAAQIGLMMAGLKPDAVAGQQA